MPVVAKVSNLTDIVNIFWVYFALTLCTIYISFLNLRVETRPRDSIPRHWKLTGNSKFLRIELRVSRIEAQGTVDLHLSGTVCTN